MRRSISLTIPSDIRYLPLALKVIEEAGRLAELAPPEITDLTTATRELLFNAIRHAYPKKMAGNIDIKIFFYPQGLQVGVHDMGLPFDFERYMKSERQGGLKHITDFVDELRFANRGHLGKSFTIFKSHPIDLEEMLYQPYSDLADESPASLKPASIQIRDFEPGDEEAISHLIYNNYTYSYYKSLFYYPKKIRELNETGEIASVVAQTKEGKIVGHFALVKIENANIAEIGVAVVHPDFKGKGIMNAMLDRIQQRARELRLDAIFGEALMMHPFSQKANLRHGFGESALMLGLVPNTVALTDPNAVRTEKRMGVLIGYKILNGVTGRRIHLPHHYREIIEQIYANNALAILPLPPTKQVSQTHIVYELSPYTQSGTLIIEAIANDFKHHIRHHLHTLYKKHVEMIYADINLMRCSCLDEAIETLKEEGFVFSGILFYRKGEDDFLRMQLVNSDNIETERIVCHSDFCHKLLSKIKAELHDF